MRGMKKPTKRTYKAKRKYTGRKKTSTSAVRSGTPFADRFSTVMKYVDTVYFTGSGLGATQYQHQVYRANGLNDLDYSNGGRNQQPMGFDALCGSPGTQVPYFTYTVSDSYIKVDLINNANSPVWVALWPSKEIILPPTATAGFEQSYSKYMVLPSNSTTPKQTIYHKFNTAKMFGEKRSTIGIEDNYNGNSTTLPTDLWYWNVYMISCDGVASLNVFSRIELLSTVEFSDRNQLGQS